MTFCSLYKSKTYFRDNVNWVWWLKLSRQSIVVNSLDNIQNQSVSKASLTKLPISFKRQFDIWVRCIRILIIILKLIHTVTVGVIWKSFFLIPVHNLHKRSIKCIYLCFMCGIPQVWFHTATFAVYYLHSKCQQALFLPSRYFLKVINS